MDKKHIGYDLNSIDVLVHVRYISSILEGITEDTYRLSTQRYGKKIRQINEHSNKETLTRSDLGKARTQLAKVLEIWTKEGNENWTCEEGTGPYFSIVFRRKDA